MAKDLEIRTTFRAKDKSSRVIGKIQSKVMTFTSKAAKGMRRVSRAASKVSKAVTGTLKYGFATASVAATGLFMAINKTAAYMDALAKKARAIDFPIEEYQEWSFVAEQSGLDMKKFDKGLNTFTKRIGKLRGGFGPLQAALKKTNKPLAKVLAGTTDSAKAMDIMIEAIQNAKTSADKSMLADAAFGVTNFSLIAGNTTEQLSKLRAEMRENGVVTAEQAAKAEAYNDMMNRVKKTVTGFMVDVLTPLMTILTDVMNTVREWAVANREVISAKLKNGLKWLVDNFDKIVNFGKKIAVGIGVFYGITTAIKVASAAMTIFNALAAMNPIGLIVIATVAAVAAIIIFRKELIQFTVGVIKKVKKIVKTAIAAIKAFFSDPKKYLIQAWEYVTDKMSSIWDKTWDKIKGVVKFAVDNLKDYIGIFIDLFTGDWDGAVAHFESLWARVKNAALSVLDSIKTVLEPILKGIGAVMDWSHEGERKDAGKVTGRVLGGGAGAVAASVLPQVVRPSVSVSRSETSTTNRDHVEVTIKDETGRAKITKGKSRNLQLAHTGAMP